MAATLTNKYSNGSVYTTWVDSDVTTNPHTVKPIIEIRINKAAYDALHANAKTDIRAVTLADVVDLAFS